MVLGPWALPGRSRQVWGHQTPKGRAGGRTRGLELGLGGLLGRVVLQALLTGGPGLARLALQPPETAEELPGGTSGFGGVCAPHRLCWESPSRAVGPGPFQGCVPSTLSPRDPSPPLQGSWRLSGEVGAHVDVLRLGVLRGASRAWLAHHGGPGHPHGEGADTGTHPALAPGAGVSDPVSPPASWCQRHPPRGGW